MVGSGFCKVKDGAFWFYARGIVAKTPDGHTIVWVWNESDAHKFASYINWTCNELTKVQPQTKFYAFGFYFEDHDVTPIRRAARFINQNFHLFCDDP